MIGDEGEGYLENMRRVAELEKRKRKIRQLNDSFRQTGLGGTLMITRGMHDLGELPLSKITFAIANFSNFTVDNDPYEEHDFGAVERANHKVFWKIDYYDATMTFGSPDASDPSVTLRVLTIMLAEEY
jgi:hypothetical protein